MKLNPSAKPFAFNPGASSWTPPGEEAPAPAPVAAKPAPVAAPVAEPAPTPVAEPEPVKESWEDAEPDKPEPVKAEDVKVEVAAPAPEPTVTEITKAVEEVKVSTKSKKESKEKNYKVHDTREHLNIVFIGHVDAGKSTISGQILLLTNQVDDRTIAKYEKEAKEKNRESWYLAYIMDTNEEERNKGKTVEVGRAHFTTKNKRYTLLDAPGHKNYVPNMIEGTAQADVGVLVISARRGEFETGFDRGGQTREHAMLAKTLGIQRLIVLVNKMDEKSVKWSQERYLEVEKKLSPFLKQWGYDVVNEVTYIPCSGLTGANMKEPMKPEVCSWYKGPPFMTLLDELAPLQRNANAALRIPIIARYKEMGVLCILGKLESGTLRVGDKLCMQPGNSEMLCVGLQIEETDVDMAIPGENILVKVKGVEEEDVHGGFVLSHLEKRSKTAREFNCQVAVLELMEHRPLITIGYGAVLHVHSLAKECVIIDLLSTLDRKTGKQKKKPRYLKSGSIGNVRIQLEESIAVESYKDFPQMGRFTIRDEGKTIAIGKVLKVHEAK